MRLDPTELRYLSGDVFRTLASIEMGSKNHEVVPVQLVAQISGLRSGGVQKCIGELAKRNLVAKVPGSKYDGYRLTYGGYDFLAMRTFAKRDSVYSVGNKIGVGKESDIYVVANADGETHCLKIHRLGRISFRTIKSKRDYLRKGQSASWMYMSRLAAMKEYAFMKVLHEHGFPVPTPIDQSRHCIVMELFDARPMRQIAEVPNPGELYSELMDLIVRLARAGLIHGDFNEFNILIREVTSEDGSVKASPILIDFPQMVSVNHENAEYYFNRDVECIRTFFKKRFRYESSIYPRFVSTMKEGIKDFELDVVVAASGFGKKEGEELERYMKMVKEAEEHEERDDQDEDGSDVEEEFEEAEEEEEEEAQASTSDLRTASLEEELAEGLDETELGSDDHEDQSGDDDVDGEEDEGEDDNEDRPSTAREARKRTNKVSAPSAKDVQNIVATSLQRKDRNQTRKHHGKKGVTSAGRAKGSKKKTDAKNAIRNSGDF